ncbi:MULTISPECIES: acyl-CoA dehydrogenase family protein [unclassified Frankia]|uniref:acyl-CoA dehydrogenase family protein n=1 Tax=unclassified Frankia TaxID=2632575 RepID=UPI002AD49078|nr:MULTISPECIES: acyl-CoA dehydrogenase family protein [unclassified Frankia]
MSAAAGRSTVDLALTDEQNALRRGVQELLRDLDPRTGAESGGDPALWRALADMGVLGLAVPAKLGGAGAGWAEVGVVLEELGRSLACVPFLSSVLLATTALLAAGDREHLTAIASGALTATVSLDARVEHDGNAARGRASMVLDGARADLVLLESTGGELLAVPSSSIVATPLATLDLTRRLADLAIDGPATVLSTAAPRCLHAASQALGIGLAAESVGVASWALDTAVAYAKVRHQFGRPIGSFQAIKHRCADMLVAVESARSVSTYALRVADTGEDPAVAAAMAQACATENAVAVTAGCIQVLGGIGFTWEHPAHLYYRRAVSNQALHGSPTQHRETVAVGMGLPATPADEKGA